MARRKSGRKGNPRYVSELHSDWLDAIRALKASVSEESERINRSRVSNIQTKINQLSNAERREFLDLQVGALGVCLRGQPQSKFKLGGGSLLPWHRTTKGAFK